MTTNALTTAGAVLNVQDDVVLFKGNDSSIYLDAHVGGVLCWTDFYTDGLIKNRSGCSVADQTGVGVWTSQCDISATGNMTTNGTITSGGLINFFRYP